MDGPNQELHSQLDLMQSGYAGLDKTGMIVDRRVNRHAIPMPKNPLLGIPDPKTVE
jgi:hypothetical protein